jgi:hypothetical protein
MGHQHCLFYNYGVYFAASTILVAVSHVYCSVRYICLGSMDSAKSWNVGQLYFANKYRYSSLDQIGHAVGFVHPTDKYTAKVSHKSPGEAN